MPPLESANAVRSAALLKGARAGAGRPGAKDLYDVDLAEPCYEEVLFVIRRPANASTGAGQCDLEHRAAKGRYGQVPDARGVKDLYDVDLADLAGAIRSDALLKAAGRRRTPLERRRIWMPGPNPGRCRGNVEQLTRRPIMNS
jgi:hypothetical protein